MVTATTESILKASLDGSGVSKGAQQIEAALAKVASAAERAEKANERLIKSNEAVARAQEALARAQAGGNVEAAAKAADRLSAAQEKAAASADKHAAALASQKKAEEELARAQEGGTRRVKESANSYDKLRASMDAAYRQQLQFQKQQEAINKAFDRGAVTDKQKAELLGILAKNHTSYDAALKKTSAGLKEVADSSGLTFQQTQVLRAGFVNLFQTIAAGGSPLGAVITQSSQIAGGLGAMSIGLAAGAAAGAIFALTATKMAAAIAQSGDEVTKVVGRFTALTGSADTARKIYDGLYQSSLQTGVAVSESAKSFTRFSLAAENIGATRAEVLKLNDTVSKSALLAGSSTSEAQAAAQQLGQALASGKLAGDEFRSVMENAPLLAQALARELGVSQGELRKMSEEGKLTAGVVFPALLRASETINDSFAKMPLTMERAGNQATVAWENFKASLDSTFGISQNLAQILSKVAQIIDGATPASGQAALEKRLTEATDRARELNEELNRAQNSQGPTWVAQLIMALRGGFNAAPEGGENPVIARMAQQSVANTPGRNAAGDPQTVAERQRERAQAAAKAATDEAMAALNALTSSAAASALEDQYERFSAAQKKLDADRAKSAALSKSIQIELDKEFAAREKLNKQTAEINEMYDKSAKGADDLALKNRLLKAATDAYTESVYKSSGAKKADAEAAREQGAALREAGSQAQNAAKGMAAFFERMTDKQMSPGAKLLDDFSDAQVKLQDALAKSEAVLANTPKSHKEYAEAIDKVTQAKLQLKVAEDSVIQVQAEAEKLNRKMLDAAYDTVNTLEDELKATMGGAQMLADYNQQKKEAALYSEVYEKVLKAELAVTEDIAAAQEKAKSAGDRAVSASRGLEAQRKQSAAQQEFARENERLADRFTETLADGIMSAFEQGTNAGKSMFDTLKNLGKTALKSAIATGLSELLRGTVTDLIGEVRGAFSATSVRSGTANVAAGGGGGFNLSGLFSGSSGGGGISSLLSGNSFIGQAYSGASNFLFGSAATGNALNAASYVPATSGVLGSGGNLFGVSGLGLGNVLGGVGSVLPGLMSGNYAQAGLGAAGAAIGSIFPGVGTLLGGTIGNLVGSLFGKGKVKHPGMGIELMLGQSGLELGRTTGKHMDTSGARPMGQAAIDAINQAVKKLTGGTVGTGAGQQVYGLSYDASGGKQRYRAVGAGLDQSTEYSTVQDAITAIVVSAVKNLPIEGISSTLSTVLGQSVAKSAEELQVDIAFAKTFDEIGKKFTETEYPAGQFQQALTSLQAEMEAMTSKAEGFGLAVDGIAAALTRGEAQIKEQFLQAADATFYQAIGQVEIPQARELADKIGSMLSEATALGLENDPRVKRSREAQTAAFFQDQTAEALMRVADAFATSTDAIEQQIGAQARLAASQREAAEAAADNAKRIAEMTAQFDAMLDPLRAGLASLQSQVAAAELKQNGVSINGVSLSGAEVTAFEGFVTQARSAADTVQSIRAAADGLSGSALSAALQKLTEASQIAAESAQLLGKQIYERRLTTGDSAGARDAFYLSQPSRISEFFKQAMSGGSFKAGQFNDALALERAGQAVKLLSDISARALQVPDAIAAMNAALQDIDVGRAVQGRRAGASTAALLTASGFSPGAMGQDMGAVLATAVQNAVSQSSFALQGPGVASLRQRVGDLSRQENVFATGSFANFNGGSAVGEKAYLFADAIKELQGQFAEGQISAGQLEVRLAGVSAAAQAAGVSLSNAQTTAEAFYEAYRALASSNQVEYLKAAATSASYYFDQIAKSVTAAGEAAAEANTSLAQAAAAQGRIKSLADVLVESVNAASLSKIDMTGLTGSNAVSVLRAGTGPADLQKLVTSGSVTEQQVATLLKSGAVADAAKTLSAAITTQSADSISKTLLSSGVADKLLAAGGGKLQSGQTLDQFSASMSKLLDGVSAFDNSTIETVFNRLIDAFANKGTINQGQFDILFQQMLGIYQGKITPGQDNATASQSDTLRNLTFLRDLGQISGKQAPLSISDTLRTILPDFLPKAGKDGAAVNLTDAQSAVLKQFGVALNSFDLPAIQAAGEGLKKLSDEGKITADEFNTLSQAFVDLAGKAAQTISTIAASNTQLQQAIDPNSVASFKEFAAAQGLVSKAAIDTLGPLYDAAMKGGVSAEQATAAQKTLADALKAGKVNADEFSTVMGVLTDSFAKARQRAEGYDDLIGRALSGVGKTLEASLLQFDIAAKKQRDSFVSVGGSGSAFDLVSNMERNKLVFESARADYIEAIDRQIRAIEEQTNGQSALAQALIDLGRAFRDQAAEIRRNDPSLTAMQRLAQIRTDFDAAVARVKDSTLSIEERQKAGQLVGQLASQRLDVAGTVYDTSTGGYQTELQSVLGTLDMLGVSLPAQASTSQQQLDAAKKQIDELQKLRDAAMRLGERQLGSLDSLKLAMDSAYTASVASQTAVSNGLVSLIGLQTQGNAYLQSLVASLSGGGTSGKTGVQSGYKIVGDTLYYPDGGSVGIAGGAGAADKLKMLWGLVGANDNLTRTLWPDGNAPKITGAFAEGGVVANGVSGVDSVLARYANGNAIMVAGDEFITRAGAVTPETLPVLHSINATGRPPAATANEAALLQELQAIRAELAAVRKASLAGAAHVADTVEQGNRVLTDAATAARLADSAPRRRA